MHWRPTDHRRSSGEPHAATVHASGPGCWSKASRPAVLRAKPCGWWTTSVRARKWKRHLRRRATDLEQRVRAAHDELAWSNERLVAELYERSEVEERARRIALYDELTELPNRRLLESRLDEALRNHQLGGDRLAVLVVDIDEFTKLNDALGHRVGDALLRATAARLVDTVRDIRPGRSYWRR